MATAYATQRRAFGSTLSELPLHVDTLAGMEATTRAAFLLAFELVELLGRQETNDIGEDERALLRLLTPIAKLLTARQAVEVVSEAIEGFGGAGYVEDTGLPALLRDTHVLPIWEGTTNVLALDALLRGDLSSGLAAVLNRIESCRGVLVEPRLVDLAQTSLDAIVRIREWMKQHGDAASLQGGARRIATTIGRALQLILLIEHAHWSLTTPGEDGAGAIAAARRFAATPIDQLNEILPEESQTLLHLP